MIQNVGFSQLMHRAHEFADLGIGPAPGLSALYRILYVFAARITELDRAPDGPEEWSERRIAILESGSFDPDHIDRYFARYADRLTLFHPTRPFLQDPRLAEQCPKRAGVNKLAIGRPAGQNHSWFTGHHQDANPVPLPAVDALISLLIWQYYGPSGRCSSRTVGSVTKANVSAGPLRSSLSYHPLGPTLFETLLAGLPMPSTDTNPDTDLCPWELEQFPDPLAAPPQPNGPMSSLTARAHHALLLIPDDTGTQVVDAYVTWAYAEGKVPRDDDYVIWQTSQQGNRYARRADATRDLWRDVDALLLAEAPGQARPQRPKVLRHSTEVTDALRVRALGFEQDDQGKDHQFVSGTTPPILDLLDEAEPGLAVDIGRLRVAGENAGRNLGRAAKQAWAQYANKKNADCAWSEQALERYWPQAEREFWDRLRRRDFTGAGSAFRRIADRIYTEVTKTAVGSVRGARACEAARIEIYGGPRRKPTAKKPAPAAAVVAVPGEGEK